MASVTFKGIPDCSLKHQTSQDGCVQGGAHSLSLVTISQSTKLQRRFPCGPPLAFWVESFGGPFLGAQCSGSHDHETPGFDGAMERGCVTCFTQPVESYSKNL